MAVTERLFRELGMHFTGRCHGREVAAVGRFFVNLIFKDRSTKIFPRNILNFRSLGTGTQHFSASNPTWRRVFNQEVRDSAAIFQFSLILQYVASHSLPRV